MRYSNERREAVLKKLFPPNNRTVADVAEEEGISAATLYKWRREARSQGRLLPDGGGSGPNGWSSQDKFTAVLETSSLRGLPGFVWVDSGVRTPNSWILRAEILVRSPRRRHPRPSPMYSRSARKPGLSSLGGANPKGAWP